MTESPSREYLLSERQHLMGVISRHKNALEFFRGEVRRNQETVDVHAAELTKHETKLAEIDAQLRTMP